MLNADLDSWLTAYGNYLNIEAWMELLQPFLKDFDQQKNLVYYVPTRMLRIYIIRKRIQHKITTKPSFINKLIPPARSRVLMGPFTYADLDIVISQNTLIKKPHKVIYADNTPIPVKLFYGALLWLKKK